MSQPMNLYHLAKQNGDYIREFSVGNNSLVLARYKKDGHEKRSRFSLFVFFDGEEEASCCYNFEPEDPEDIEGLKKILETETDPEQQMMLTMIVSEHEKNPLTEPVAYFGEHFTNGHATNGEAPNELTIDQFRPIAFKWAASLVEISIENIQSVWDATHSPELIENSIAFEEKGSDSAYEVYNRPLEEIKSIANWDDFKSVDFDALPKWASITIALRSILRVRGLEIQPTEGVWNLLLLMYETDYLADLHPKDAIEKVTNLGIPGSFPKDNSASVREMLYHVSACALHMALDSIEEPEHFGESIKLAVRAGDSDPDVFNVAVRRDVLFAQAKYESGEWDNSTYVTHHDFGPLFPEQDIKQALEKAESDGGCFIATSCYGSVDHPSVEALRYFRDNSLSKSTLGRMFIALYYTISPRIAFQLEKRQALAQLVRQKLLDPLVASIDQYWRGEEQRTNRQ